MTLILGVYTNWHAFQVSDRLVSVRSFAAAPPAAHDVLANKTVVLFARRGIVAISYTGLAYLAGVPTAYSDEVAQLFRRS